MTLGAHVPTIGSNENSKGGPYLDLGRICVNISHLFILSLTSWPFQTNSKSFVFSNTYSVVVPTLFITRPSYPSLARIDGV